MRPHMNERLMVCGKFAVTNLNERLKIADSMVSSKKLFVEGSIFQLGSLMMFTKKRKWFPHTTGKELLKDCTDTLIGTI